MNYEHSPVLGAIAVVLAGLAVLALICMAFCKIEEWHKASIVRRHEAYKRELLGDALLKLYKGDLQAAYRLIAREEYSLKYPRAIPPTDADTERLRAVYNRFPPPGGVPPVIAYWSDERARADFMKRFNGEWPEPLPDAFRPQPQVDRGGETVKGIRLVSTPQGVRKTLVDESPDPLPPSARVPAGANWYTP